METTMRALITLFSIFLSHYLFAETAAIIYKTDPEYQFTEFSRIEAGRQLTNTQHSITRKEFAYRYKGVEPSTSEGFRSGFEAKLTPSITGFYSPYASYGRFYPQQMIYLYEDLPSIASLTLYADINSDLYMKFIYEVGSSKTELSDGGGLYHPFSVDSWSAGDSPTEAYISYAKKHYSLTIGRFKGGIGHGLMGNLIQNSQTPYYDQFQFTFYNKVFKYDYMLGFSSYYLTNDERSAQNQDGDYIDYDKSWGQVYENEVKTDLNLDNFKAFAYHHIDALILDAFSISLAEMSLVGGKYPDYNMINPFGMYHDIYDGVYTSYLFSLGVSWVPAKRHFVFLEVLSNEIQAPGERNGKPTATGIQSGYWFIIPSSSSLKQRIGVEATHLDGWTYSDYYPYQTMYQRQKRREIIYDVPLGYAYGGDCEQFSLIYTLVNASKLKLECTLSMLYSGEIDFSLNEDGTMDYESAGKYLGRPSGTVEEWKSFNTAAEIPIDSLLSICSTIHYSYISNFNHEKGNTAHLALLSLGLSYSFK